MLPGIGMTELIVILVIVLILFGAKRLPDLASGLGKAIKNFKKATTEPDQINITPKKSVEEKKEEGKGETPKSA